MTEFIVMAVNELDKSWAYEPTELAQCGVVDGQCHGTHIIILDKLSKINNKEQRKEE